MCGYGPCGHYHGCHHGWGYGPGWDYGPGWGYGRPYVMGRATKEDEVQDLEDYKDELEAEIRRLEKRIGSLKEK